MANSNPIAPFDTGLTQLKVIGISGATRSGKTQLSKGLYNLIGSNRSCHVVKLGQDRYFFDYKTLGAKLANPFDINWDHPSAMNWDKFYSEINRIKKGFVGIGNCFLIIEGFMIFYEKRLRDLFDCMIWLDIDKLTCYNRRMKTSSVPEEYFQTKLWPNYIDYRNLLFEELKSPLFVIDGTKSQKVVLQTAENIIHKFNPILQETHHLQQSPS